MLNSDVQEYILTKVFWFWGGIETLVTSPAHINSAGTIPKELENLTSLKRHLWSNGFQGEQSIGCVGANEASVGI